MSRMIEIPDWCVIGKIVYWSKPRITGFTWVKERIIAYSDTGFFHQGDSSCPVYHTEFSEFDKTIKLEKPNDYLYRELSYYEYM